MPDVGHCKNVLHTGRDAMHRVSTTRKPTAPQSINQSTALKFANQPTVPQYANQPRQNPRKIPVINHAVHFAIQFKTKQIRHFYYFWLH